MEPKTKNIILWTISGLLAVAYVLAGSNKVIVDPAGTAEQFQAFGLPAGLATFVGVCEVAGGIGLLIPRLASLAASGLVIIMLGAVYSHVTYTPIAQALPALVLGSLCGYVAYSRS